MCLGTIGLVSADYQAGVEAYERGDYETALQELRPLAEGSNPQAQYFLGRMYANGWGIAQDYEEAVKWYHKAAEQGYAFAQSRLGYMYETSWARGLFKTTRSRCSGLLRYWFQLPFMASVMYYEGEGVVQDYEEAVKGLQGCRAGRSHRPVLSWHGVL